MKKKVGATHVFGLAQDGLGMLSLLVMIAYLASAPHGLSAAALVPIAIVGLAFEVFCLIDVFRAERARYLPRWLWALITLISVPLGGIIYLVVGRPR